MFGNKDDDLNKHLSTSSTIKNESLVIAEWNLNYAENISMIGNYRYRPGIDSPTEYNYGVLKNVYDSSDAIGAYTGATDADILIDGGYENDGSPAVAFKTTKEKQKLLFSLEDCFKRFRPRSGINKFVYFDDNTKINFPNSQMDLRPRYYTADKDDVFKYWSSYRTENGIDRGISKSTKYIDDVAPFIVYKQAVPANKIVVKMQTNVGSVDLSTQIGSSDPFYGTSNDSTPDVWKIQRLNSVENKWEDLTTFDSTSNVIGSDGYFEISYGLVVPDIYKDIFVYAGELSSINGLPEQSVNGYSYLIKTTPSSKGIFKIWLDENNSYAEFDAAYGWTNSSQTISKNSNFATDLVDLTSQAYDLFGEVSIAEEIETVGYRQFQYIRGLRVVVQKMKNSNKTFDLIELSPRLTVNLTDKVSSFSVKKMASDLGVAGLPVGQLLAGTGNLTIFDYDKSFFPTNYSSIISKFSTQNLQIKFYELILDVPNSDATAEYDYYVPIKTMYAEGFPEVDNSNRNVSISLRDLFLYFESTTAQPMLLSNVTLSYALTILFDSIGFSNYRFLRNPGEADKVIENFFVGPDMSVAQILNDLAVSTQSAMFFDESNNFIVMSRNYMMPLESERSTDLTLYGSEVTGNNALANIAAIQSELKDVYNDGKILYTTRYIQKTYGSIEQANKLETDKTWVYKPVLLWEVSAPDNTRSTNDEKTTSGGYTLSAVPLSFDLEAVHPTVNSNNQLIDNVIDFGEGVYWLGRYNGYFYANGEVIKYDAIEYSVPGGYGTVNITGVTQNGPYTIYSAANSFQAGNVVNISGIVSQNGVGSSLFNVTSAVIIDATSTSFTIENNVSDVYVSGGIAESQNVNIWITSTLEYEKYFAKLKFGAKIFPTGRVRIYSEPNYETVNNPNITGKKITRMKAGAVVKSGRAQFGTKLTKHSAGINPYWYDDTNVGGFQMDTKYLLDPNSTDTTATTISYTYAQSQTLAKQSSRTGVIKNFMSTSYITEDVTNVLRSTKKNVGAIQASALSISGPTFATATPQPLNFVSYVYKKLENRFVHFGTRMRIIGKLENAASSDSRIQSPVGSVTYYDLNNKNSNITIKDVNGNTYTVNGTSSNKDLAVGGAGGGIGIMVNPTNNTGYYFEIAALTDNNVNNYTGNGAINNIFFYKMKEGNLKPEVIWSGYAQILTDDGKFTGQSRVVAEKNPTIYDLSIEYRDISGSREFTLFINNKVVTVVTDTSPLAITNNVALFVRGSSKCMFENIYALSSNYAQDTSSLVTPPLSSVFSEDSVSTTDSFNKFALSGAIQETYLSGISSQQPPNYNIYFDEFGTIMREAAYFNIRYDKAYPALLAKISPTFNSIKGYTVSGFVPSPYGAEFLIFNNTDTVLVLDETSGNYLRIQGVTFTQQTQHELSVDEYFSKKTDFSNPQFDSSGVTSVLAKQNYMSIKNSRLTYGKKDFSLDAPYIQNQDAANELMSWLIEKIMKPRHSVGLRIFSTPTIQLGDIVKINYITENGKNIADSRFIVYYIEYAKSASGPDMTVYLSEVA